MTDIEKLKELEAKAVAARIEYMNDLVDGPEKYHRCVNEYKNALYIEAPALLASLASKDAEIERLNEWKSRLHSQVDDFAERYAQAAQEPKQLRAELTTALAERDEALERAATKATSFLVGDPENGVPFRSPMPHEIADAIRKMKALS